MQSSLTSDNYLNPKFLARGASLLARKLWHKNTDIFRASLLAILEWRESPLSPTQLAMAEDILTSPLWAQSLSEINRTKYCDFDTKNEQHKAAIADLLRTEADQYVSHPEEATKNMRSLLKKWEQWPVPPEVLTSEDLWNSIMQKQMSALRAHRLRQFLESLELWKTQLIDVFNDEGSLRFDPQNLLLGVVNERWDAVMGNQLVHGLIPTWKPWHVFCQHMDRYAVCTDSQGRNGIVHYSNQDLNWPNSGDRKRFLEVISAEEIIETRELQTYNREPLFLAHIKTLYGDEYVIAHTLNRMPQIGVWNLVMVNIADDFILIHDNNNSGSFGGRKIVSIKTGEELEVRYSEGDIKMSPDDWLIRYEEARKLRFDWEKPNGKEFFESIGWWLGTREVRLSELVAVWKKIALKEAGINT